MFETFQSVGVIPEESISQFESAVPAEFVQAWREHGTGYIGDGYFRLVDPVRAADMLGSTGLLPPGSVVLMVTALADIIAWSGGVFLVVKSRLGEIQVATQPAPKLIGLLDDKPGYRDKTWDWQPYPAVRDRLGVPGYEDCFMHVPLLMMGGRGDPDKMQVGSLWMHIALMTQMTGQPQLTGMLPVPDEA